VKEVNNYPGREAALSLENAVKYCGLTDHTHQRKSMEVLYKKYYGYILAIILRYVRQQEDAEELVNESFVRVFANIGKFVGKGKGEEFENFFKAWLSKICVNASIDFLRAKKMSLSLDDIDVEDKEMPFAMASDELQVKDILALMNRLPELQRTIFNLYEVEGYNHEEIAEMLNIPHGTSRTYLMRAKKRLKALYMAHHDYIMLGR